MSDLFIITKDKEGEYYRTINLTALLDSELSWKAKGLHDYIRTRPSDWELYYNDLSNRSTDGEASVRAGINELVNKDYLTRIQIGNEKKQIIKWAYISFQRPTKLNKEDIKELLLENLNIDNKRVSINIDSKKEISSKEDKIPLESNSVLSISIFNKRVQNAFSHWQGLSNTVTHGESKVRNEALKDLDYYIKKHSPKTIKQAMNVYNTLLTNPFIMTTKNAPFKVGLNEFFKWGYSKNSLSKWKDNPVANIKSWFDVCLLGIEEAERIMTKISKDDNPKVTKKLKKEFNIRIEKIKNPEPRDENAFISTSRYIIEFLKVNNKYLRIDAVEKRNPVLFVPYLYDYLAENNNGNKQHPGWFTNDYFYDNFPVWMVKKGHMIESRKVKRR